MIAYRDRATGAQVWQVTEGPAISHRSYFLQSSFFPGGREMFFSLRIGRAPPSCSKPRSIRARCGRSPAGRLCIPFRRGCIPRAKRWCSPAAAACGPSTGTRWQSARLPIIPAHRKALRQLVNGYGCNDEDDFQRLRASGLIE